ncbi:MAG: ISAzo13 family transposase, partial [Capsulimonas sp.]
MIDQNAIRARFECVAAHLDERDRRIWAAAEARAAGYGGILAVSQATKVARSTIGRGLKDLDHQPLLAGSVRRAGGGRPPLILTDPTLISDLQRVIEPTLMGDPMRPLLWVSKSLAKIALALKELN